VEAVFQNFSPKLLFMFNARLEDEQKFSQGKMFTIEHFVKLEIK
jgi:hypothetical protein